MLLLLASTDSQLFVNLQEHPTILPKKPDLSQTWEKRNSLTVLHDVCGIHNNKNKCLH